MIQLDLLWRLPFRPRHLQNISFLVIAIFAIQYMCDNTANGQPAVETFSTAYCTACHTGPDGEGGLDLTSLSDDLLDPKIAERWVRIHDRVESGEMPPPEADQPTAAERRAFLETLSRAVDEADKPRREVILRRLNRVEYENTLSDLFGVRIDVQSMLPADASAAGFDNVGEALAVSTEQMQSYLAAADAAIDQAIGPPKAPKQVNYRKPLSEEASDKQRHRFLPEGVLLFNSQYCPSHLRSFKAPCAGTYRVRMKIKAMQSDEPVILRVNGGDTIAPRNDVQLAGYWYAPTDRIREIEFTHYLREFRQTFHPQPHGTVMQTREAPTYNGRGVLVAGHIVIAGVDDNLTVKRLQIKGDDVYLKPENKKYDPIKLNGKNRLHIWGVVTNIIHRLTS